MLYSYQFKKLNKKKCSDKHKNIKICQFVIVDMIIGCILIFIITVVLPIILWNVKDKTYQIEDEVLSTYTLRPLANNNNKIYVREALDKDAKIYTVNVNGSLQQYDSRSTELVEDSSYKDSAEIVEANEYNVYELKGYGIVASSVNDMYADIYLQNPKKTFIRKKTQICVPENSVEKIK